MATSQFPISWDSIDPNPGYPRGLPFNVPKATKVTLEALSYHNQQLQMSTVGEITWKYLF